jgi:hypothetical protein
MDPLGLFRVRVHDIGGRMGPAYGAIITVESDDGTKSITVPGSSWPNPKDKSPGIEEGTYSGRYSPTGHKNTPGINLQGGGVVPTLDPNPRQNGESVADHINVHCGWSGKWRGSQGCITIHPDYCQSVWDLLDQFRSKGEDRGTVGVMRRERPGF